MNSVPRIPGYHPIHGSFIEKILARSFPLRRGETSDMARLTIRLLGPVQIALDGEPLTHFESAKALALLALLAGEPDRSHRREALAEMLWPDRPEGAARANLRHTLAHLRRVIGDRAAEPPFLLPTRNTLQFNKESDAWIDASAFSALLSPLASASLPRDRRRLLRLSEAVGLYRGPFLEALTLADSAAFEEWRVVRREHFRRLALQALATLVERCEQLGEHEQALAYARRELDLEPWDEPAHRRVMRLLALTDQRTAALAQYKACTTVLADELGVEPDTETTELYQRIREGGLQVEVEAVERRPALRLPRFVLEETRGLPPPLFVARDPELARLAAFVDRALHGMGSVAFVTGGPGQGKSALLAEFARRAMEEHPDLLVAEGEGNAYSGSRNPYLPFRDVLAMLTGDLEARWLAGSIGYEHARRLWAAVPLVLDALVARGSSLVGTLIQADALVSRAAATALDAGAQARVLAERARTGAINLERSFVFEQCTSVLRAVAAQQPLVLVLDDLQWADQASIGLLFHLGRRLAQEGCPILIVCAYRPEELGPRRGGERHPLEKVLLEFKRTLGDVWIDLDLAERREGRRFVDAYLDAEPNRLGEEFRATLFQRTAGHPLFTTELLRAMQERGDLVRDEVDGAWLQGSDLDWQALPARVEAAIEVRVQHLDPGLRELASVASVEGDPFTAQVVAAVQGAEDKTILHDLRKLASVHRLVSEQGEVQIGSRRAVGYRFGHILVQEYLYRCLSPSERRLLHGRIAIALESLYEGHVDQIAVKLAHHFFHADDWGPALHYSVRAAANAARTFAHEEAIALYTQAIGLAPGASLAAPELAGLHRRRGAAHETLGSFEQARSDFETALAIARSSGVELAEWGALLDLARLWGSRDYGQSRCFSDEALDLARRLGDPSLLAESLNWIGNWHLNTEDLASAIRVHGQALAIVEQIGDEAALAATLDRLGLANQIVGDPTASIGYYDRAIRRFRRLKDRYGLAASLTGRGLAGSGAFSSLTLVTPVRKKEARRDLEEALAIAREIDAPSAEAWALWALSLFDAGQGRYGAALEDVHKALDIASAVGHREWTAGSRAILGQLYVELGAAERARSYLSQALALAERLQSRHWVHQASGALAAACILLDDLEQAQSYLDAVLLPDTPMDTVHKRTCWARRAELALCQGQASLALDIVERLIASAPGMSAGRVIPFLWWLKAEALASCGQPEEALSLLHAAVRAARSEGERFLMWRLHASLARQHSATDRSAEAETQIRAARQLVRELADTIPDEDLREGFLRHALGQIAPNPKGFL